MDRREAMRRGLAVLGISAMGPASAFDLGNALGAAKSLAGAATISDKDLNAYFAQMSDESDKEHQVAAPGSAYGKRLATLTSGLAKHDGLNLNFKVYIKNEVNAFAMGNGTVRLYSGLLDQMTDDEVRYVIGHEVGHVKAGHSKKRMQLALTASGLRSAAAATDSKVGAMASSQIGDLFEKVVRAQHSQSNENEADDYALKFMKAKKYAPMAAVTALEKLDKLAGGGGGGWMSTHPAPAERAKRLRSQIG